MLRIFDLIICPAGRALRGFVGTLLRISRDREPYGSSASPFWTRLYSWNCQRVLDIAFGSQLPRAVQHCVRRDVTVSGTG